LRVNGSEPVSLEVVREGLEGAACAAGFGSAKVFCEFDQQCMVLVEQLGILGEVVLEQCAELFIVGIGAYELMTGGNPGGVGIDDEDGTVEGVEEDRVGGFQADAFYGEQLSSQLVSGDCAEVFQSAVVLFEKPGDEVFETFGFYVEIAGGSDQFGELVVWDGSDGFGIEAAADFEVADRFFDVGPAGVLSEDGADDDFKRRFAGPPALRSETVVEAVVDVDESLSNHGIGRRFTWLQIRLFG